jgi:HAD superfamily phosphatase (TIGR01668 family)
LAFSLLADVEVSAITELSHQWFQEHRIRLMLLDFDNTIIPYTTDAPSEEFLSWLRETREAGVTVMVVSNSRKSRRVPDFCEKWEIPYIKHAGKPRPGGIRRAMEQQGFLPSETALAGDQTFTDILGGNLAGVTSVLVHPIHFSNPFQVIRYNLERPFIALGRRKRKR